MQFLARLIATGFFTGYAPVAPGTAGSILGLFLYWLIPDSETHIFIFITVTCFFLGVWAATAIENESGIKDNQIIVIDEIIGVFITCLYLDKSWVWLVAACLLFRFFDILKPYPAKKLEKLPSGWGVMMDDVAAAVYSFICLRILLYLTGQF